MNQLLFSVLDVVVFGYLIYKQLCTSNPGFDLAVNHGDIVTAVKRHVASADFLF